jgi:hypothetical protein
MSHRLSRKIRSYHGDNVEGEDEAAALRLALSRLTSDGKYEHPTVHTTFTQDAALMAAQFGVVGVLLSEFVKNFNTGNKAFDMAAYIGFSVLVRVMSRFPELSSIASNCTTVRGASLQWCLLLGGLALGISMS